MDKGFAVLEIDPEFKTLIRPLRKDEYLQLEVNLTTGSKRLSGSAAISSVAEISRRKPDDISLESSMNLRK